MKTLTNKEKVAIHFAHEHGASIGEIAAMFYITDSEVMAAVDEVNAARITAMLRRELKAANKVVAKSNRWVYTNPNHGKQWRKGRQPKTGG